MKITIRDLKLFKFKTLYKTFIAHTDILDEVLYIWLPILTLAFSIILFKVFN